jgi:hypothetical protein
VINESPYTQDGQTVVRNFFLYQWMGGSTWAYTGKYTADYTRVGEASISNAGSLLSPISTTWFNDTGYSQFADTALPIPDSGLYFSNGFQVYAVGMQLRRYSMRTGPDRQAVLESAHVEPARLRSALQLRLPVVLRLPGPAARLTDVHIERERGSPRGSLSRCVRPVCVTPPCAHEGPETLGDESARRLGRGGRASSHRCAGRPGTDPRS